MLCTVLALLQDSLSRLPRSDWHWDRGEQALCTVPLLLIGSPPRLVRSDYSQDWGEPALCTAPALLQACLPLLLQHFNYIWNHSREIFQFFSFNRTSKIGTLDDVRKDKFLLEHFVLHRSWVNNAILEGDSFFRYSHFPFPVNVKGSCRGDRTTLSPFTHSSTSLRGMTP